MTTRKTIVAVALCLFGATPAFADNGPGPRENIRIPALHSDGTTFSAEALSGDPATGALDVRGLRFVDFEVSLTWAAASSQQIACYTGSTPTDVTYQIQSRSVTAGVATYSDYSITKTVSASKKWKFRIDLHADNYLSCTFAATGETSDSLTITSIYGGVE
jgi:hypothetical protein